MHIFIMHLCLACTPQPRALPCTWTSKPVLTTISGIQAYKNGLQGLSATYIGVVRFTGAGRGVAPGAGRCGVAAAAAGEGEGAGKQVGKTHTSSRRISCYEQLSCRQH